MATKVFIPGRNIARPQTPEELQSQLTQGYQIPKPGGLAAADAVAEYMPFTSEVPPLPTEGIPGVMADEPLSPDSTTEDLARATQSPNVMRPSMAIATDENGQPMLNAEGTDYQYKRVGMQEFSDERAAQTGELGNMNMGMLNQQNYADISYNAMMDKKISSDVGARHRKGLMSPSVTHEEIKSWSEEEGNALSILATRAEMNGFGTDAYVRSIEPEYEGMPATAVELAKLGILDNDHKRLFSTLIGAASSHAIGQATMFKAKDTPAPVDNKGKDMVDARPVVDIVNSTAAALRSALERVGYSIPMDSVRRMAAAEVVSNIANGHYVLNHDRKGREVISASKEVKQIAREMAYTAEALAGDHKRNGPSNTPQFDGSDFRNPGSQTTANSRKGVEHTTADIVKNMMGHIGYIYNKKDIDYKEIELNDILKHAKKDQQGRIQYSNSIYAKRNKVHESAYTTLTLGVKPDEGYKRDDLQSEASFKQKQHEHAVSEINNKIDALKYDITTAREVKGIKYISMLHDTSNQRFYENSRGMDAMSSKGGVREMRNFAEQDIVASKSLFDPEEVKRIKAKGLDILRLKGRARQKEFDALPKTEQGAIAAMMVSVINYYTTTGSSLDPLIVKQNEATVLAKYTPAIGLRLAELGNEYNAYMKDPEGEGHDNIKGYLAGMPRGEALGNKNLWDDMSRLALATNPNQGIIMTYLNFDDGKQNGIFLQSLFFGHSQNAKRLGSANPRLGDMRDYAHKVIGDNIESMFQDYPEKLAAWKAFFKEAGKVENMASDLFKKPLMQNAYSMDASMFGDEVEDFLSGDDYQKIAMDTILKDGVYSNLTTASEELNNALEATLREIVNQHYPQMMMKIGRYSAVMGSGLTIQNIDGDMMHLSPVGLLPIRNYDKDEVSSNNGDTIKLPGLVTDDFQSPDGDEISIPVATRRQDPNYSKGVIRYFNRKTGEYDVFENYSGSSLSRQAVVMAIQAADGGMVKLTHLAVNSRNPNTPRPAAFVHDAINAPGSSALMYRNAYNNIAIPQGIEEIMKFGQRLDTAIKEAEANLKRRVEDMSVVGIGENGDFPSTGALFDESYNKFKEDGSYKQRIISKNIIQFKAGNPGRTDSQAEAYAEDAWKRYKAKFVGVLNDAKSLGWRPPGTIEEKNRANIALPKDKFLALVDLAAELLKIKGPEAEFPTFVSNFAGRVKTTRDDLMQDPLVRAGGIVQMSTSGGGGKVSVDKFPAKPVPASAVKPKPKLTREEAAAFNKRVQEDRAKVDALYPETKPDAEGIPKREPKPKLDLAALKARWNDRKNKDDNGSF